MSCAEVATDDELAAASKAFRDALRKMRKASDARRALPIGSSRARVTTANSRWATACEAVERLRRELVE